jgi:glutamate-1-semialdehyde aminotransferase
MVTLAKAICGGYPGGAIGMTAEIAALVADGRVHQYGTFNGNPLVMAAAQATLTEVLTEDAYAKLESSNDWLLARCDEIIESYGLPCYTEGHLAKAASCSRRSAFAVSRLPHGSTTTCRRSRLYHMKSASS